MNQSGEAVRGGCLPNPQMQEGDSIKGHITALPGLRASQRGWRHQGVTSPLSERGAGLGEVQRNATRGVPHGKGKKRSDEMKFGGPVSRT